MGILTQPSKSADVVTFDLAQPQPKRLTGVNDDLLHGVKLGDVEEFTYSSPDNLKIQVCQ